MGKQVRFFMVYEDEESFLDTIGVGLTAAVILTSFFKQDDMIVRDFQPSKGIIDSYYGLVQLDQVEKLTPNFYREPARFSVDVSDCNVVQFNRCYISNGRLVSGRLWYESLNKDGVKPESFTVWAEQLLKWIRRNLTRDDSGFYVGEHARRQVDRGVIKLS